MRSILRNLTIIILVCSILGCASLSYDEQTAIAMETGDWTKVHQMERRMARKLEKERRTAYCTDMGMVLYSETRGARSTEWTCITHDNVNEILGRRY
jgi:hypothetical protein